MPMLDIFDGSAFSMAELTEAINIIPNSYGRIGELGLFTPKGISTTTVTIELRDGILNLLSPTERGGESTVNKSGKRRLIPINMPFFSHEDAIYPKDIQNARAFGSDSELETVSRIVADKLDEMKGKHDITEEYMRAGALQGQVRDDEGGIMVDFYETFGITPPVINFNFSSSTADVGKACRDVSRHIAKNLKGERMTYVHCLCDGAFFESLISHPSMVEAYHAYQGLTPLREDMRSSFKFQNILFEEYPGEVTNADGDIFPLIPANTARFFPMGTTQTFRTFYAPGDFEECVNTLGLPLYAKQEQGKFNRRRDLISQSSPLPICMRPAVLVKGASA